MIRCSLIQRQNKCRFYPKFSALELRPVRRADLHRGRYTLKRYLYRSSNEWVEIPTSCSSNQRPGKNNFNSSKVGGFSRKDSPIARPS
ncbi:unnamed protein product [Clonostachys byssicola]|uniref:Uncharacterized protein n=1 Tax=Clonostachys byssicola TaxID=160290 RepID=A0A9N9UUL4_9HYPO|nr:unnamed protein product [Clonostachys byssicola]